MNYTIPQGQLSEETEKFRIKKILIFLEKTAQKNTHKSMKYNT